MPVRYCYGAEGLVRVENSSGQKITLMHSEFTVSEIRLGDADGPKLVSYSGMDLSTVCYGEDCSGERWDYSYQGGSVPSAPLLAEVRHGLSLQERHTYCAQTNDCPVGYVDSARRSETASQTIEFTYRDATACSGGTRVDDLNVPSGDPWRTSCVGFESASGNLLSSTGPTGCASTVRQYEWSGSLASAVARPVEAGGASQVAWTTRTHDSEGRLVKEAENDVHNGSSPPDWARRSAYYLYGDASNPRIPTTIYRPSVLAGLVCDPPADVAGCATTRYLYDGDGNPLEHHETGWTHDASGSLTPFHYVAYAEYVDVGAGGDAGSGSGARRLRRLAGPIEYLAGQEKPWHTELVYYGAGAGTASFRLRQVIRDPQCPGAQCAGQVVEQSHLEYDALGRAIRVANAAGEEVLTGYDRLGRVTSVTRGAETTRSYYDAAGRLQLVASPAGNAVHYHYEVDANGFSRLNAVTRLPAAPASITNDRPAGSERVVYAYDAQGNVTLEETYRHPGSEAQLDAGVTDGGSPAGELERVVRRVYRQGRAWQELTATGQVAVEYTFDSGTGAVLTRTERASDTASRTLSYNYDWNRLVAADATHYAYDRYGNLTLVTDERGRQSSFAYDDLGRLVTSATPSGGETRFWYTARGDLAGRTDARGLTIAYAYDALGRVLAETAPDAGVSYTYDGSSPGRLQTVADTAGVTSFGYDVRGRVTLETRTNLGHTPRSTGYTYDANGNLATVTYPEGTLVTYGASSADPDRSRTVTRRRGADTQALATDIAWHAGGSLAELAYGNGAVLTRQLTLDGAPAQITVVDPDRPGTPLWDISYGQVDWLGRPHQITRRGPGFADSTESYAYDDYGRLTATTIQPPLDGARFDEYRYRYTGPAGHAEPTLGNRTQQQRWRAGGLETVDAYAAGAGSALVNEDAQLVGQVGDDDRLRLTRSADPGQSQVLAQCAAYDQSGNLTAHGYGTDELDPAVACAAPQLAACFEYDAWGRMTAAGRAVDGSCAAYWWYRYDWKGRRVSVVGQGAFASKRYDYYYDQADRLITEVLMPSDAPQQNYYYLGGEPLAQETLGADAALYFVHNDHLGTPQRMSQADRTIKWAARFSPFGEAGQDDVNGSVDCDPVVVENPLRFPGQFDDRRRGTGFHYYNYHRYYDPTIGRYTQPDPAWKPIAAAGVPENHIYAYVGNNPLVFVDPEGLWLADPQCGGLPSEAAAYAEADQLTNYYLKKCVYQQIGLAHISCNWWDRLNCWLRGSLLGEADVGSLSTLGGSVRWCNPRSASCGPKPCGAKILVHEFAHRCGWHDTESRGNVPGAFGLFPPECRD
jgi:RHS repeat-associated protein